MTSIIFSRFLQLCGLTIILGCSLTSCASSKKESDLHNKQLDELLGTKPHDEDFAETQKLAEELEKRNREYREYQDRLEMRDRARWDRRFPN